MKMSRLVRNSIVHAIEMSYGDPAELIRQLDSAIEDSGRLDYLEQRTALSNSGLTINPNIYQKVPAKSFELMWRHTRAEAQPTLRAAIDLTSRKFPLVVAQTFEEDPVVQQKPDYADPVVNKVMEILREFSFVGQYRAEFLAGTLLTEAGADSLDFVEVVMAVEDEFSIVVPDDDIESFTHPYAIAEYIKKHRKLE